MIQDPERAFYHQTIARLLEYNGTLITALVSRGQQIPMPTPPEPFFNFAKSLGVDPTSPNFGVQMEPGDQLRLSNAWKDYLLSIKKMMDQNFPTD